MKDLLIGAKDEILSLRRRNEVLSAKVETMELLAGFLHAQVPCRNIGMTVDVAWKLEKAIEEIRQKEEKNAQ